VGGGAAARGAIRELTGVLPGVLDHLVEGLDADGRVNDEAVDDIADAADRIEALQWIVGSLAQARQYGKGPIGRKQEGIAVGRRLGHRFGANHAAGSAAVL